jgi:putative copper export protein
VVTVLLHADKVTALLASQYARVLGVKLALVLVAGAIGAFNWRRVRPALGTEAGTRRLRLSAANEIAIGLLVVIVTAVLVATKTPT